MHRLTDEELLRELAERVDEKNRALFDLRMTTRRLEEVNRRLVESEALKADFLSNVRNEVNNPLAAILAISREMVAGIARGEAECGALAAAIQREAFALDFQLRNIFVAAEIEAGEAMPMPVEIDLRALVEETVASFQPLAAGHGVELRTAWEGDGGRRFTTDPAMLQLVLANLLSNAVKFGAGKPVRLLVSLDPGRLRLRIEDQGIGIAAADHAAIFERFRQLDAGRTKGYAGHGLGLSVVKAVLELLGGSIAHESVPGAGTRFTVEIPEAAAQGGDGVFADAGNEYFFDA